MTRERFYEWLRTCPAKENGELSGFAVDDDAEFVVHFWVEEEKEEV